MKTLLFDFSEADSPAPPQFSLVFHGMFDFLLKLTQTVFLLSIFRLVSFIRVRLDTVMLQFLGSSFLL